MRKDIADYIRTIYDKYDDHISVEKYENIRGLQQNIFFFNHKEKEKSGSESSTKINIFEA